MRLDLQRVVDDAKGVELGPGIRCFTRPRDGRISAEYWIKDRRVATAYLAADLSACVDVAPAESLGPIDVLLMMAVMNLANSRASQMSYVAQLNKPVFRQTELTAELMEI